VNHRGRLAACAPGGSDFVRRIYGRIAIVMAALLCFAVQIPQTAEAATPAHLKVVPTVDRLHAIQLKLGMMPGQPNAVTFVTPTELQSSTLDGLPGLPGRDLVARAIAEIPGYAITVDHYRNSSESSTTVVNYLPAGSLTPILAMQVEQSVRSGIVQTTVTQPGSAPLGLERASAANDCGATACEIANTFKDIQDTEGCQSLQHPVAEAICEAGVIVGTAVGAVLCAIQAAGCEAPNTGCSNSTGMSQTGPTEMNVWGNVSCGLKMSSLSTYVQLIPVSGASQDYQENTYCYGTKSCGSSTTYYGLPPGSCWRAVTTSEGYNEAGQYYSPPQATYGPTCI
jgi:hypothetical protein